ncbi:kinesin [Novymonas esmeraldas]|uniref:Kinesin n=1 Tax=Novymonas esmeraldas TaxID=1808958 RepID=A0AAW0EKB3_9TRYP
MASSSIKVAVRCRPLLGQERPAGGLDIQPRRILLDSKTYDPDFTFPPTATQDDVFHACQPILQCVKEGMNGTIMVYGQTGTGKTHTMLGSADGSEDGLVHMVVANMLEHVQLKTADGAQCALTLSMIEIYNERLTDMLSPNGEEEVTLISGFPRFTHKVTLCRVRDAVETIRGGLARRHTAATLMNERSSRSHVVFIFDLEEFNAFTGQTDVGHLFMIDLAGSESVKKSQASGVAAGEAGRINKSLLALKSVLLALSNTNEATRPSHVPYRDSRLTELLQDSIGGTARTLMIACISAVGRDIEETKSTLLYAVKARSIRNAANTEREKLLIRLRSTEAENQKLRNRLQERVAERGGYYVTKEEHEQTQEMAESHARLTAAVEQLMQDRQNSDARRHIWESQVKVLRAILDDKETELQGFKAVYHDALQRFEYQASALQRLVRGDVAAAKDAVQTSFADNYARLHAWRTELLAALEEAAVVPAASSSSSSAGPQDGETALPVRATDTTTAHDDDHEDEEAPLQRHLMDEGAAGLRPPEAPATAATAAAAAVGLERCSGTPPPSSPTLLAAGRSAAGLPPVASPLRSTGAAGCHPTRPAAAPASHSARGSIASSLQRGSAASAAPSTAVSPTRRPGRPRGGAVTAVAGSLFGGPGTRRGPTGGGGGAAASAAQRGSGAPLAVLSPPLGASTPPPTAPPSAVRSSAAEEGHGDATTTAANTATGAPTWPTVMAQYDAQCVRTVHRLNEAVAAMLEECMRLFDSYREGAELAEARRRHGIEAVCQRLRSELESSVAQLQRVEVAGERDVREARASLSDQLRMRAKMPPLADAAPFQVAVRDACRDVVRHASSIFPQPGTPAPAEAALDVIARNVRRSSTAFTLQALDPLSSYAVAAGGSTGTSCSSAPSSPMVVSRAVGASGGGVRMADLDAVPPLAATATCGSPSTTVATELTTTSPSDKGLEGEEEQQKCGSLGDRSAHSWQGRATTTSPPPPQQQQACGSSGRLLSSLRSSAALTSVAVNSHHHHNNNGSSSHLRSGGGGKRTRSTATASSSSTTGDMPPSSRRATAARRSGR